MKHYTYKTTGTCSKEITFDIDNGKVISLEQVPVVL